MELLSRRMLAALLAAGVAVGASGCSRDSQDGGPTSAQGIIEKSISIPEPGEQGKSSSSSEAVKSPADDAELIREILVNYGAEQIEGRLEAHKGASLFQRGDWDSEHPLPLSDYYIWSLGQLWNEDISPEERFKKYAHPSGAESVGWFFPQALYEEQVTKYFQISPEELRAAPEYDAKYQGYAVPGGGGFGATPEISLYRAEQEGELLKLHLTLVYDAYNRGGTNEYKILTVRAEEGGGCKYVAYATEKNPPQEQIDTVLVNLQEVTTGETATYVSEELGFTVTFPEVWAGNYTAETEDMGFQDSEEIGRAVAFYYKGDSLARLLTITAVPLAAWEPLKARQGQYIVELGKTDSHVFTASPFRADPFKGGSDKELFDSMYMTKEQIAEKVKFELKK